MKRIISPFVQQLQHVYRPDEHEVYHGFRKVLRAILSMPYLFNTIFNDESATVSALNVTDVAYHSFGDLNNVITAYLFYKAEGNKTLADQEKVLVQEQWPILLKWAKDQHLPAVFDALLSGLTPRQSERRDS